MPDERFAIASDHAGVGLKAVLRAALEEAGRVVIDLGPRGDGPVDYPDFAQALAREIESGRADRGVLICGSGIGMSIAVNRSRAVRGALCRATRRKRGSRAPTTTPTCSPLALAACRRTPRVAACGRFWTPTSRAAATARAWPSSPDPGR